jgi:hypothetical protein
MVIKRTKIAQFYYIRPMDVNINYLDFTYQCLPIEATNGLQEFEKRVVFGKKSSNKMAECAVFQLLSSARG